MLTYKEEEDLNDEDLEGSVGESRIFKEVFFGYEHDTNSRKGLISGTTNEYGLFKHTEDSLFSNSGNSAITSQVDSCYAKEDLWKNSANRCSSGGDAMFLKSDHGGNNEWMKFPADEPSYSGHYYVGSLPTFGPSKRIVSGISRPSEAIVTCRLVESSGQGITSSCFLMKRFAKNDVKEAAVSKSICSPVSGESSGNKLLVGIPIDNVANDPVSHHSDKKTLKSSKFHSMPATKVALDKDSTNNPKSFLRSHVQELLRDAGWGIGRRKREKSMGEFLYYSPWRKKPIRQFRRVWNLCGRRLFSEAKTVLQEEKKWWADMTHLCSDLYNTVLEIEREMSGKTNADALARRWYLLDPFVNMVFVDKKLNILKAGKSVRARRSIVTGSFKKNKELLPSDYLHISGKRLEEESEDQPGDTSVVNESPLTVYDTKETGSRCKKFSGIKRSRQSMTFSTACGADSTFDYFDSCLFEVPISYEDANLMFRVSETASPSHDCNNFSQSFDGCRSDNDENIDMEVQESKAVVSYESDKTFNKLINENVGHQFENSYLVDVDIEVMVPRSYVPESRDTKKEDFLLEQTGMEGCCIAANEHTNKTCRKSLRNSSYRWIGTNQNVELGNVDSQNEMMHAPPTGQHKDIDPYFSAIRKSKSLRSSTKKHGCEINSFKSQAWKKHKGKKGSCKLVPRYPIKGKKGNEGESSMLNARTVLSWLVDCEVISLGDTIQCRNKMDDTVVKYGFITRDGILCKCCGTLLSVSKFKGHAGFRLNHPYLDLYVKSGKSFAICYLEAWTAEYKVRKSATQPVNEYWKDLNDDKCGLCGDMGELICCDNCPSTFHQACLEKQELPEGSWYCMHCSCRVCGDLVDDSLPLKSHVAVMCLQCENKYHRACLEENGDRWVPFDGSFCCQRCQEVYQGLNSRIGFVNHLSDGFSWTLLKCIDGDRRNHSVPDVAVEAECNTKLAVALTIVEECFLPILDSRTGIDMIPHILYNMRSEYPRLNYNGFYTVVLETDDVLISVASIRIHGVKVAEMPLVATCIKYQHQGMFRRLLHSIEELLNSFKVEKLIVSALPSLVETWTTGFGFTLMEDDERKSLKDFNLMVFPGTVWLKKHILISPKTLQGHQSSSITNSRAETICCSKRPVIEFQKHSCRRSSANAATNKVENRHMNSRNLLTERDDRHGILYKHLLKLPWGEPDSSVGRIRVDVGSARENVLRMSQRSHASQDIC